MPVVARYTEQLIVMAEPHTRSRLQQLADRRHGGSLSAAGREVLEVGMREIENEMDAQAEQDVADNGGY